MELISYIKQKIELPEELIIKLDEAFIREELPKGYKLLAENNLSKKVYFFEKGLARWYYHINGKNITHYFFVENTFTLSLESVFYDQPSPYGLELIENSVVRSATYSEVEKLIDQSVEISKTIQLLLIDVLRTLSDRLYTIQFQTAQERYHAMLENYPNIFLRAPLGHIASYLGITQETLSRIRSGK